MKKIANIHQSLAGNWYITDNALAHLDERGMGHGTERQAIKVARDSGNWTHRVNSNGKIVKL